TKSGVDSAGGGVDCARSSAGRARGGVDCAPRGGNSTTFGGTSHALCKCAAWHREEEKRRRRDYPNGIHRIGPFGCRGVTAGKPLGPLMVPASATAARSIALTSMSPQRATSFCPFCNVMLGAIAFARGRP